MAAPTSQEIADALAQSAIDPQAAAVDGQSVTAKNPHDIAFVQDRVATSIASTQRRRGISFTKLIPAGPLCDAGGTNGQFSGSGGC